MKKWSGLIVVFLLLSGTTDLHASTTKCFMAKDGFVVAQPYMVTRGCFLFHHGANIDLENQSDLVITLPDQLHPDPIHAEFLRFILDRKLISLKKETPLFSCDYDLPTLARDYKLSANQAGTSRTLGYELPQFSCAGTITSWTPVRPVNEAKCYWVAVPLVRCDEPGSELEELSVTEQETDEE